MSATRARALPGRRTVIVGGGLGGCAAAVVLAERGVPVTILEREAYLGGRVGAWTETLADGSQVQMERGFHAFFRQYYNLRALLRRVDPDLRFLKPLHDYPLLGPGGRSESFSNLPTRAPLNVAALVARTPSLRLRDLMRVNKWAAMEMLRYDPERTWARYDGVTAGEYLDSLRFPADARQMLFDIFAHSFFNPEGEMSAGELLMMFHFYFLGNPEGLVFDVLDAPFSTALWEPLRRYLEGLGAEVRCSSPVEALERVGGAWRVLLANGDAVDADALVLAPTVPGLQALVARSPGLGDAAWRAKVESLALTRPFAVWRLWTDRPLARNRAPFAGTTGVGPLDNISVFEALEDESAEWARRTGGGVVELHAYAVEPGASEAELRAALWDGAVRLYPELAEVGVVDERFLLRQDCPAFAPDSHALRPGVVTSEPTVTLAGDFVRLEIPSALMERATASGFAAANAHLARWGIAGEPIRSVPTHGLFTATQRLGLASAPRHGATLP